YFNVEQRTLFYILFFFSSRRRHTRFSRDWSSDVCSSDLLAGGLADAGEHDAGGVAAHRLHPAQLAERDDIEAGALAREQVDDGRSEERRVGEEWRSTGSRTNKQYKTNYHI